MRFYTNQGETDISCIYRISRTAFALPILGDGGLIQRHYQTMVSIDYLCIQVKKLNKFTIPPHTLPPSNIRQLSTFGSFLRLPSNLFAFLYGTNLQNRFFLGGGGGGGCGQEL